MYIEVNRCPLLSIVFKDVPDGYHVRVFRPQRLFLDCQCPLQQWAASLHMPLQQ